MLDRRGFLKFGAGVTTGLVASPIIWNTLYDAVYWTQSWSWIPRLKYGENTYVPTVSKLCPSGTGIRVRLVEGRPVRALGNPDNPLSQGGLTALAAAETQLLVSPARLKKPLKRSSDGAYVAISWDEAKALLTEKVKAAGQNLACISGDDNGVINEVFSALLKLRGSTDFYLAPGEEQAAAQAWELMGAPGRMGYDIEHSDYILAIGANILESWGTVVYNRKVYGASHGTGEEITQQLAYAGPVQNNTATGADTWLPIRAGSEMFLALGIAHLLIKDMNASLIPGIGDFSRLAAAYDPAKVEHLTGVDPARLQALVTALKSAEKPMVIVGTQLGQGGGAGPIMAGIALNVLLGRLGQEGNLVSLKYPPKVLPQAMSFREMLGKDMVKYSRAVAAGTKPAPKVLMLYETNPMYALPPDAKVADLLQKAEFTVSFTGFMDESAAQADLVLPAAFGLERFDDVFTPYGSGFNTYTVGRPVLAPLYEAQPTYDVLLGLAASLDITEVFPEDMPTLLGLRAYALGADINTMLETGETFVSEDEAPFLIPYINASAIASAVPTEPGPTLAVAPVPILGFGTPETGIPPFATKIITDQQLVGKEMVAQMNAVTAAALKMRKGDRITLTNESGTVTAQVALFEGVMPNTVALPLGLGHTAFDEFSQNKGANIMNLTSVSEEPGTGLCVWGTMGVNAAKA